MRRLLALAGIGTLGAALWWRKNPSACPYSQRFFIELPHPGITRGRLIEILEPRAGERVLEIGPGTGYYTFEMAARLDGGQVDVFDIQQEMLDHVVREANKRGVTNVMPALGDAQSLPYSGRQLRRRGADHGAGRDPGPGAGAEARSRAS